MAERVRKDGRKQAEEAEGKKKGNRKEGTKLATVSSVTAFYLLPAVRTNWQNPSPW